MKKFIATVTVFCAAAFLSSASIAATLTVESSSNSKECKELLGGWHKDYVGCVTFTSEEEALWIQENCVSYDCGYNLRRQGTYAITKYHLGYTYSYTLVDPTADDVQAFSTLSGSEGVSNVVTITYESRKSSQIK